MRSSLGSTVCLGAFLVLVQGYALHAVPALGYMGGAIRAQVVGIEPGTDRVFYYRTFHDESGAGPEVWFFDLNADNPELAKRAPALDGPDDGEWHGGENINEKWRSLAQTLRPLPSSTQFDLRINLTTDSVGVEPEWNSPTYEGHLAIKGQGIGQACTLTIFCEPMITIRGLYSIPGRQEAIAVVSYVGRSYGCEEVERPVLLTPDGAGTLAPQHDRQQEAAPYRPEPFVFGKTTMLGCCAGQFKGGFVEAGPPGTAVFSYLAFEEVMVRPPQVWLISLVGGYSPKPIRYSLSDEDSIDRNWDDLRAVRRAGGRGGDLVGRDRVDLTLHLTTESAGSDPMSGARCYHGELTAETPSGRGSAAIDMFCDTAIAVRGVYPLPAFCELVIMSYTRSALGRGRKDVPIVIYPTR
ncbi:MAG TPA: hypothetical protein VMU02_01220 [bacterium]|nr:hypothetical protein [bacterium]